MKTHYDNLKVLRSAPPELIKAAYKTLAQKYHPDLNPGSEQAARIMVILNQAYAVLSDPIERAKHDLWIVEQEQPRPDPPARPYVAPQPSPQREAQDAPHASQWRGIVPDPQKARGIWWLRFCRWVFGVLLGFDIFSWSQMLLTAGRVASFVSSASIFYWIIHIGWTWLLWFAFHDFRRRINDKHTLGFGYPHPSMKGRWSL